jgi:hypothetical protein
MTPFLTRQDYNKLVLLAGVPESTPAEIVDRLLAAEYPSTTEAAAAELTQRGLMVDFHGLHYLARKGRIETPPGAGRNLKWSPEHIDAAALALAGLGWFTPTAERRVLEGVDAGQELRAEREAAERWPNVPADLLVRTVIPGALGAGVPAVVRYRPMAEDEAAERTARIAAVQK